MKKLIVGLILVVMVGVCWGDVSIPDPRSRSEIYLYTIVGSLDRQNQLLEEQNKLMREYIRILKDDRLNGIVSGGKTIDMGW